MLRRETLIKQAEMVKRKAEQQRRRMEVEQAEKAVDALLSVAWSVGRC